MCYLVQARASYLWTLGSGSGRQLWQFISQCASPQGYLNRMRNLKKGRERLSMCFSALHWSQFLCNDKFTQPVFLFPNQILCVVHSSTLTCSLALIKARKYKPWQHFLKTKFETKCQHWLSWIRWNVTEHLCTFHIQSGQKSISKEETSWAGAWMGTRPNMGPAGDVFNCEGLI